MGNTKQKSILHYVFKYAGTYKVRYFISIAFALMGVCFSMIPFMLMGKLVENLVKGNRDFQYYKSLAIKIVRNADKILTRRPHYGMNKERLRMRNVKKTIARGNVI